MKRYILVAVAVGAGIILAWANAPSRMWAG
jgi:hypothetical protein